jgi:uncharacterized protein YbjT (DUF2867 family)
MTQLANSYPRVLITGATGNVGRAVIAQLSTEPVHITAGVRNIDKAHEQLGNHVADFQHLDFASQATLQLDRVYDAILLVRPPQLGDVKRFFEPFIQQIDRHSRVIFLSVQGANSKKYLPHAQIESLIEKYQLPHVFLRPSYFMENLVTVLYDELTEHQRIFLPSGSLAFNWVAVEDIAKVAKNALLSHIEQPEVDITSDQVYDFQTVVKIINQECGTHFRYESPGLLRYLIYGIQQGYTPAFISVMLLLHYLPRFQKATKPSNTVAELINSPPTTLRRFIRDRRDEFIKAAQ